MTYDSKSDRFGSANPTRQSPAVDAVKLTAAMLSDSADLATYAKALRVWNGSSAAITLAATPLAAASDATVVPITVPAGVASYEPISARRIWSTGSTGLAAALAAGTAEVLILTL
ncbi:MAG: hypothetical protein LWW93_01970 [Hyphomicrobiales bacterium]|nr:hypothetical protein [Hyphomicrobiales bacterium]